MLSTQDPHLQQKKPFLLWRPFVAFWHWMFPPTLADLDRQSNTARVVAGSLIIAFSIGLVVFVVMNAGNWHGLYQNHRSESLVERSKAMEAEKKYVDALNLANQAFQLSPENPNAIRSLARFATMMKRNEARFLWDKLRDSGEMTLDDQILEIRAMSNLREDKSAAESIQQLLANNAPTRELVEVADQVMSNTGQKMQLIEVLKTYVEAHPDDLRTQLVLSVRQIQFGDASDKTMAIERLWKLAESQEETGLKAIEFLDNLKLTSNSDIERLITLLEKHPLAEEEHRVAALRRLANLYPERKSQIIDDAMKSRANTKREDLVPLARWITIESQKEHSYAEKLLDFLREDQVIDYIPLLENYLNALTVLNRHDALERLIKDPRTRLTQAQKSFYLMHLAYIKGVREEALNEKMVDALLAAQNERRADLVMKIAGYAEVRGHPLAAEQAFRAATTYNHLERDAYDGLLRLTYQNGNSKGFMDASGETARRWPDNQFFLERVTYASLLSGIEMEGAIKQAQKLIDARPDDSQRKLIMALALARQMDPKSATRYLERINLSDLSLGQGAVLCGIMKAAGIDTQARSIANQIPEKSTMLPEEQRFLQLARN
ncbi:hypothetical protein FEM03_23425 [Phragmitibacter flavus]|uniref:Tetratricopeptide repeat protein n=1 Tax=Phragmitibacter flavus TaxID=2576071 RepID=A0A5R8K7E1_9BACT|nr:hypothetical protein [Phragmitibacter flavus]TLD68274.1 hypothetical protein FEM03_23425 [Phragmitibacter flavus]